MKIEKFIDLHRPAKPDFWRKIALHSWRLYPDASIYAFMDLDLAPARAYLRELNRTGGLQISLTHFVGKALATVYQQHPDLNCIIKKGRIYPRKSIDIFFQVAAGNQGEELSGAVIREIDQKSLAEIAMELNQQVLRLRRGEDENFNRIKKKLSRVPSFLLRSVIRLNEFIHYGLNLWHPSLGTPKDSFGSGMITNIGSLGLEMAFVPIPPFSRVPLILSLGAPKEKPVVRNGQLSVSLVAKACFTLDHRLIDGVHAARMARTFEGLFLKPEQLR